MLYLTKNRFYAVEVVRDLLGELVISHCYGGRHNRITHTFNEPYRPERLAQIDKERRAHKYVLQ